MIPLVAEKLPELRELCRRFGVGRLELFGSAANGAFKPETSDLDFLVEIDADVGKGFKSSYFRLLADLEDLFGRKIDLVESRAIRNPYFAQAILNAKRDLIHDRSR